MAVTFTVSDVAPGKRDAVGVVAAAEVLEARGLLTIEASSVAQATFLRAPTVHGLLAAAHLAFSQHLPLVLGPDEVWVTIAQGLARWIDAKGDELRSRIVRHEGQLELEVRRDEFVPGDPNNDWPGVYAELSERIREHIGGRRDLFVADFSTTNLEARAASEVVLLGAMQKFFRYSVATLCGIPSITLEGTPADWANVRRRAQVLAEFGLDAWLEALSPVLAEFEAASRGNVDRAFWAKLYKPIHASGGEEVSGWINALFPWEGDDGVEPNPGLEAWTLGREPAGLDGPKLGSFPAGLTHAPFKWKFLVGERDMSFVAGFFGVEPAGAEGVRARLGWAVAPAVMRRHFRVSKSGSGLTELWPLSDDLRSLASLRSEAEGLGRLALVLWFCRELQTLDELRGVPGLVELTLMECGITDLGAIADLPDLRRLSVQQCFALRDIGPLAACTQLEELSINHCPLVTDLRPVASLPNLTKLSLFPLQGPPPRGQFVGREAVAAAQAELRR